MKSIQKFTAMFVISLALASCNEGDKASHHDHSDHEHTSSATPHADAGYPLTTCVVSGEDLGSMGTPVEVTYEGTTVKLCCKSCIKDFNATPAVYVAKLKGTE